MKLMRLSKKIGKSKTISENSGLDISWASGPGYRGGPENYFSLGVEGDDHDYVLEMGVENARRLKEQVDDFLQRIERGEQFWETGNYFKRMKKRSGK